MSATGPYGGRRLIADSSAWSAIDRARKIGNVPPDWPAAIMADQILTSPIVRLELLHSTRSLTEFDEWNEHLAVLREVGLTHSACLAAIACLRVLAGRSDGYHRVGLGDALIAASAQDVNPAVGVLHYNHEHFRRLAEVLAFEQIPLAPPGTFEQ